MHDASPRQLAAMLGAFLAIAPFSTAAEPPTEPAMQLQTLKGRLAVVAAGGAKREAWVELEKAFDELVLRHPGSGEIRLARGDFFWEAGMHDRAIGDWREAERIAPKSTGVSERIAKAALSSGDARGAAEAFRRALKDDPENPSIHFALANVCFLFRHELLDAEHPTAESRLVESIGHFATASRLEPANAAYAKAYAETFYSLQSPDWTQAIEAWDQVRKHSSESDFALLHQARIHLKLRHFDAARACLQSVQSTSHVRLKKLLTDQLEAASAPGD